jgi:starch phosphorylase
MVQHGDVAVKFCSDYCKQKFLADPDRYPEGRIRSIREKAISERRIAYFSMEIAIGRSMPTYSGGLGVLAGDHLKSCADLQVPIVGVTLLSREGYFEQHLDAQGRQTESPVEWEPERFLHQLPERITISIEGRSVLVGAWRYDIIGKTGHVVPVILLDTDTGENSPYDGH